jgi:hypothetical protein
MVADDRQGEGIGERTGKESFEVGDGGWLDGASCSLGR